MSVTPALHFCSAHPKLQWCIYCAVSVFSFVSFCNFHLSLATHSVAAQPLSCCPAQLKLLRCVLSMECFACVALDERSWFLFLVVHFGILVGFLVVHFGILVGFLVVSILASWLYTLLVSSLLYTLFVSWYLFLVVNLAGCELGWF